MVIKSYWPNKELLGRYVDRVTRQAETLGEPLDVGAMYEHKIYEGARGNHDEQLQFLRRAFVFELLEVGERGSDASG